MRPVRMLLVLALVVATAAVSGSVPASADGGPVHAVRGPACPDVMILAARGSGEAPQADWADPGSYTDPGTYYGAGEFNVEVADGLVAARPGIAFSLDSVMYPANAVPTLMQNPMPFLASTDTGRDVLGGEITRIEQACGGTVRFLFTGYSQGAWVVHKALWRLATERPALLGKVVGVALFGDPLFEPQAQIVRDARLQTALWQGVATPVDGSVLDVPVSLRPVTASYCLPHDPICQALGPIGGLNAAAFTFCDVVEWTPGLCPHTSYGTFAKAKTTKAISFLAGKLPAEFTKTVNNTIDGAEAFCRNDDLWSFELHDVAGTTGINPPSSIRARTVSGATIAVPRTTVNGDAGPYPQQTAFYETAISRKLTGTATAVISQRWNPPDAWFGLTGGPCTQPNLAITAKPPVVQVGATINLNGRLTTANGRSLAGQPIIVLWHSTSRLGKGQQLGPFTTDAQGRFTATVVADEPGIQSFGPIYQGSGPTALAQFPSEASDAATWALPATLPSPVAGPLGSSAGTTFTRTSRGTVLSGSGYLPHTDVGIALYPGARLIATTTTNDSGAFSVAVSLPAGIAGRRTVLAIGNALDTDDVTVRYLTLPIIIAQ